MAIAGLTASGLAQAVVPTPGATEGPFYPGPAMRFDDIDNNLVTIAGRVEQAGGEVVRLQGQVLDQEGRPVPAARVEIWQCDVRGRYLHSADSTASERDGGFQGFGHDISDQHGRYSFQTIKPVAYSGRTPHIHLKILLDGRQRLTTQLYLPDHPGNARDWLYQRIPADQRELVTLRFEAGEDWPLARLNLVI